MGNALVNSALARRWRLHRYVRDVCEERARGCERIRRGYTLQQTSVGLEKGERVEEEGGLLALQLVSASNICIGRKGRARGRIKQDAARYFDVGCLVLLLVRFQPCSS